MWYDGSYTSEKQAESGWPPKFEEYAEYERELNDAIGHHPPFRQWLCNYRSVENCLSEDRHDFGMWKLTVDELKERYVKQETLKRRVSHAKRVVAERLLHENEAMYQEAQNAFAEAKKAYEVAFEQFTNGVKHGYNMLRPAEPLCGSSLRQRDDLRKLCERSGRESVSNSYIDSK